MYCFSVQCTVNTAALTASSSLFRHDDNKTNRTICVYVQLYKHYIRQGNSQVQEALHERRAKLLAAAGVATAARLGTVSPDVARSSLPGIVLVDHLQTQFGAAPTVQLAKLLLGGRQRGNEGLPGLRCCA